MRLPFVVGLAASLTATLLAACSETTSFDASETKPATPGTNGSIAFESQGPLQLTPGEVVELAVATTPPDRYPVNFRLVGDSRDASLDVASAIADESGRVEFRLRAPSEAATFAVRATIQGGASVDLVVSVSDKGFGTIEVAPHYDGGRAVEEWVASVTAGTTCAALAPSLPDDPEGALVASAPVEDALVLTSAPVGPPLAVMVRAGRYAWGCTDVTDLAAGTVRDVEVHVTNKPVDPTKNRLTISLAVTSDGEGFGALLAAHEKLLEGAFSREGTEAKTLLATMVELSPTPASFAAAAETHGWLALLATRYAAAKTTPAELLAELAAASPLAHPTIVGALEPLPEPGSARFSLGSFGPLAGEHLGVPSEFDMTLSVDPSDEVHLGGTLGLLPSRYLGAAIALSAKNGLPGAPTVPEALAATIGCATLALPSAPACNDACTAALCKQAFDVLWSRARDASADAMLPAQLPLKALGAAVHDDEAVLTGFSGSWLGQLQAGAVSVKVAGDAQAELNDEPAPE